MSEIATATTTKTARILVIGKHDYILEKVESVLREQGYETFGTLEDETVLKQLRVGDYDALLIGGGVAPNSRLSFIELIQSTKPHMRVIEHFGGPATLVHEVKAVLPI
ncbi:MAG: hypothetical protein RL226_1961 [Bacteroidota bacterium]